MNIFVLDYDPLQAARMHCDKHVLKMMIEYAQLLSTAHRVLDGVPYWDLSRGRRIKRWTTNPAFSEIYQATHVNHPCAVWVRENSANYSWTYALWRHLTKEYTYRYGKCHSAERLYDLLIHFPAGISTDAGMTPFPQAMPDEYKREDTVEAYRAYYIGAKARFATWKIRERPEWFVPQLCES